MCQHSNYLSGSSSHTHHAFIEIICTGLRRACYSPSSYSKNGTGTSIRSTLRHKRRNRTYPLYLPLTFPPYHPLVLQVKTGILAKQPLPHDHARHICTYHEADEATVARAIDGALAAKAGWESMPWNDRAAIFLKAADLVSGKYRYKLIAATMLGQGKNVWQAEIDAAAEVGVCLFFWS